MNIDILEPFNRLHLSGGTRITAVHVSRQKLYIGLSNGNLTIFRYSTEAEPAKTAPRSLRSFRSFSEVKRLFADNSVSQLLLHEKTFENVTGNQSAIAHVETIPLYKDSSREVLLLGNADTLQVYEWVGAYLNLVHSFDDARGYAKFCYMEPQGKKVVIIGTKKKVLVYLASHRTRNIVDFVLDKEIALKERVRAICAYPEYDVALIGLHNLFMVLHMPDYRLKSLPAVDSAISNFSQSTSFTYFGLSTTGPELRILKCLGGQLLIVRDTQVGVVEYANGKFGALRDSSIKLAAVPVDVAFLYPCYLLVVYPKTMEVVEIASGTLIQEFRHQLNVSSSFLAVEDSLVVIGAASNAFQFNVVPYQKQLDQYLSIKNTGTSARSVKDPNSDLRLAGIDRALTLVASLEDNNDFFDDKSDPSTSRQKMKALFLRDLYKEKCNIFFNHAKYHAALVEIASEWILSVNDILPLFPDFLNGRIQMGDDTDPQMGTPPNNAVRKVTPELLNEARNPNGTISSATESDVKGTEKTKRNVPGNTIDAQKSQLIRKFRKAVNNLIIYLTDQRRINLSFLESGDHVPTIRWKDTDLSVMEVYQGWSQSNIRDRLLKIGAYIDTTLFLCYYYTKPVMLGPLLRLPNNQCSAKVVNESLLKNLHGHTQQLENFISELLDFYFGRKLHKDALVMLHKLSHDGLKDHDTEFDRFLQSPDLTIKYLQRLTNDNLGLVLEYSTWILGEYEKEKKKNAELIFMSDSYECESYDNLKVFDYFKNQLKDTSLAIRYLEWLLHESDILALPSRKTQAKKLTTYLCDLYLRKLKALKGDDAHFFANDNYEKLFALLKSKQDYDSRTVLADIPADQDKFLRLRVLIFKRLGEHTTSVDVLYSQLDDLDGAMEYCEEVYREPESQKTGSQLFMKLLSDLLMHYEENQDSIAHLLRLQGNKMPVLEVLTLLPNSFPMHKLTEFLIESATQVNEKLYETRVSSQLYKVGAAKTHYNLLKMQTASYAVLSGDCPVCGHRFGKSVLCVDDHDNVVHYGCYQKA